MNKRYARIFFFILLAIFLGTFATQLSPALRQDFFQGSIWENAYAVITNFTIVLAVFDYAYDKNILPRPAIFLIMVNTFASASLGVGMELYENWSITTQGEVLTMLILGIAIYGSALFAMYSLAKEKSSTAAPTPS